MPFRMLSILRAIYPSRLLVPLLLRGSIRVQVPRVRERLPILIGPALDSARTRALVCLRESCLRLAARAGLHRFALGQLN